MQPADEAMTVGSVLRWLLADRQVEPRDWIATLADAPVWEADLGQTVDMLEPAKWQALFACLEQQEPELLRRLREEQPAAAEHDGYLEVAVAGVKEFLTDYAHDLQRRLEAEAAAAAAQASPQSSEAEVLATRECAICMGDFVAEIAEAEIHHGQALVLDQLGCGHIFHHDCLADWVNQDTTFGNFKPPECPTCRRDARTDPTTATFPEVVFTERPFTSAGMNGQWWVRDVTTVMAAAVKVAPQKAPEAAQAPVRPGETVTVRTEAALAMVLNNPNVAEIILTPNAGVVLKVDQVPARPDARLVVQGGDGEVSVSAPVDMAVTGGRAQVWGGGTVTTVTDGKVTALSGGTITTVEGGKVHVSNDCKVTTVAGGVVTVTGGTVTTVTDGEVSMFHRGTITTVAGGMVEVRAGTITTVERGWVSVLNGGTITTVAGGRVEVGPWGEVVTVIDGKVIVNDKGTIHAVWGGRTTVLGGTVDVYGGTVEVAGGLVRLYGGTAQLRENGVELRTRETPQGVVYFPTDKRLEIVGMDRRTYAIRYSDGSAVRVARRPPIPPPLQQQ